MSAPPGAPPGGGQLPPGISPNAIFEDLHKVPDLAKTHGVLMGLVFVIIFPLGSFIIRLSRKRNMVWFHTTCQIIGWALMLAGLSMGIKLANILDLLHKNAHTVLGTVVVAALILQPFLGLLHHWRFKKTGGSTIFTTIHKWYGRVFIILGIVTGGSGLALASKSPVYSKPGMIVYAVLAAISGVSLVGLWVWVEIKKQKDGGSRKGVTEGSVVNGA
ncbi:uncharacterized protein DNG_05830 [Cephalotrichum gorgonifer]|uniref:Cytochrome b561 domain-containing protein n=1 Tax=Cephalotrichum gorgonifer TaxID=2041049 RepID=A0AAE8SVW5_9PEZI|nr:uncharacterized protein DNG_05830 [Cephalotrichum gorgonifer]